MTPAPLAGVVGDTIVWLADADHWHGTDGIPARLGEHVAISLIVVAVTLALALPVGLALGHTGRGGLAVVAAANTARAVPSFGLIVLGVVAFGIGVGPVLVALVVLAVPPVLVNAYAGVRSVDPDLVEAARGQGMSGVQVLRRVEAPVALPLVLAGIRTAVVLVVATATLAAVVPGVGGLGPLIVDGIRQQDLPKATAGAVLVAALATVIDLGLALVQRVVTPPGVAHR